MVLRDALKGNLHCALFGHSFLLISPLKAAWCPPWQLSNESSWNLPQTPPLVVSSALFFPLHTSSYPLLATYSLPHSYSVPSSLYPTPLPLPLNLSVPLVPLILSLLLLLFFSLASFLFFPLYYYIFSLFTSVLMCFTFILGVLFVVFITLEMMQYSSFSVPVCL